MSRRTPSGIKCHFCQGEVQRIADAPADKSLYCYGCREFKDAAGYGHKDDLAQGLRLGETPATVPPEVRRVRLEERHAARTLSTLPDTEPG